MVKNSAKLLALVLTVITASAFATPQYRGITAGNPGVGSQGPGYYIWSNQEKTNWKVRWQARDESLGDPGNRDLVSWWGTVDFFNSTLDTYSTFRFENTEDTLTHTTNFLGDSLELTSVTNDNGGVDGFNFSITGGSEVLEIDLWASFFTQEGVVGDNGVASDYIFIGQNADSPNVLINRKGIQSFEVKVPEPGSIALLGIGLIGLDFARKKAY